MRGKTPEALIDKTPTTQSVRLRGVYISITALASDTGINHSYLSRILSNQRNPSLTCATKIAASLHWSVEELVQAIEDRFKTV